VLTRHPNNQVDQRGRLTCRLGTAISCRSTNISTSFDADDRVNSTNQNKTVTKNR